MTKNKMLLCIHLLSVSLSPIVWTDEEDRTGPTIVLPSSVYQVGNKCYCPLCRQEVARSCAQIPSRHTREVSLLAEAWTLLMIE